MSIKAAKIWNSFFRLLLFANFCLFNSSLSLTCFHILAAGWSNCLLNISLNYQEKSIVNSQTTPATRPPKYLTFAFNHIVMAGGEEIPSKQKTRNKQKRQPQRTEKLKRAFWGPLSITDALETHFNMIFLQKWDQTITP